MNRIHLENVEITKMKEFETANGTGINLTLRDSVGSRTVYYQTAFYGDQAIVVKQSLTVGDIINVSGTMWVKLFTSKTGKDGFNLILENPANLYKQSLYTRIAMPERETENAPGILPEAEGHTENPLPF